MIQAIYSQSYCIQLKEGKVSRECSLIVLARMVYTRRTGKDHSGLITGGAASNVVELTDDSGELETGGYPHKTLRPRTQRTEKMPTLHGVSLCAPVVEEDARVDPHKAGDFCFNG